MKKCVSLLLLPLLATGALAQDIPQEDAEPELRRYTVEIIIFAYAQEASAGSEVFPPDIPPAIEMALDENLDQDPGDANTLESVPEVVPEPDAFDGLEEDASLEDKKYELVMLAEEDFGLVETYEQLELLDAYQPLLHFGWTQPTYPDEEVEARPLSSFVTPPKGLEGDFKLYLSRYLHLAVKLQLDEAFRDGLKDGETLEDEDPEDEAEEFLIRSSFDDGFYDFGDEAPVSYPVHYRIDEDRIFRNGELRYFDHPKFGVLARITRVEEEEEEEEIGELLGDMELLGDDVE